MSKSIKIKDLVPDDANFNTGTEFGNSLIDKSLSKFGAGRSILIDKNNRIIAGNKTIENAAANGFNDVVIVETTGDQIVAVKRTDIDLNTKKGREMALADNATAKANISWDAQALTDWDMPTVEWGIDLTEFVVEEVGDADAEPQIDKAAELNKKWKVKSGDLWQIGEHRLLCGDSTKREDVERLMGGQKAELLFTSPPYSDQRDYEDANVDVLTLAGIFSTWQESRYFVINLGLQQKEGEVDCYWDEWILTAKAAGHKFLAWNVWDKVNATSVRSQNLMFARQHEWIFVFGDEPKHLNRIWEKSEESKKREAYYSVNEKGQKVTTRRQKDGTVKETPIGEIFDNKNLGSVVTVFAEMSREITSHPAMFPPTLPSIYIEAMTDKGQIVCEPFAGSGTTLVACQNLNRKCYAIEISENYCAVILERMATAFPDIEIKRIDGV